MSYLRNWHLVSFRINIIATTHSSFGIIKVKNKTIHLICASWTSLKLNYGRQNLDCRFKSLRIQKAVADWKCLLTSSLVGHMYAGDFSNLQKKGTFFSFYKYQKYDLLYYKLLLVTINSVTVLVSLFRTAAYSIIERCSQLESLLNSWSRVKTMNL